MALVTQVSNLRTYNPKFSDFGINQAVEQPIPVEPSRTAPKEIERRLDDVTRLNAFLTSGKGVIFASKQVGLDQDLSLELNPRKRLTAAANTASRLVNIALQASPAGQITRFSSNPFGRYIDARDLVDQIGDLQRTNAPSLAKRGSTIIPDYEVTVPDVNGLVQNIDKDPTSLKSTLETDRSKFDKPFITWYAVDPAPETRKDFSNTLINDESVRISLISDQSVQNIDEGTASLKSTLNDEESAYTGYAVAPASQTRKDFGNTLISDLSVENKVDDPIDRPRSENRLNIFKTDLNTGFNDLIRNPNYTKADSIRFTARRAQRDPSGNFKTRVPYITNLGDLSNRLVNKNNNVKLIFDAYTAKYRGQITPIEFIASLENFSDSYSSNWNSTQYIGRGEPVYNFNSTSRAFNFSFKAYSESAGKVRDLYKRLNQLASYTNPTYTGTFMAGTFVKLTLGDYLVATPGFLGSVDFSWETSYPWEVTGREQGRVALVEGIPLLPHVLDVSISFTPIHNFIPEANPNTVNRAFIGTNDRVSTSAPESPGAAQFTSTDSIPEEDILDLQTLDIPSRERAFGPVDEVDLSIV